MDELTLNEKKYPFWYAVKAQREMQKMSSEKLVEKDDIYFIWLALKYGALKQNIAFDMTEERLVDIFEDDLDTYKIACDLLGEQMGKMKQMKEKSLQALQ